MLTTDYDRLNPLTKDIAIDEFKTYIDDVEKARGLPNDAEFAQFQVNNEIGNRQRSAGNKIMLESYLRSGFVGSGSVVENKRV
jgi:hypothetical protein